MFKEILKKAIEYCEKKNYRLTNPRLKVLEIITCSKRPLKAYEILKLLGDEISNPKPPTVYRAIEFWKNHNFIHRIESLSSYAICTVGHSHNGSQYLICNSCGKVIEAHICKLPLDLRKSVEKNTFRLSSWNLEINGICNSCN